MIVRVIENKRIVVGVRVRMSDSESKSEGE